MDWKGDFHPFILLSSATYAGTEFIVYVVLQNKEDSKFKYNLHVNQQTEMAKDYSGILWKNQSHEIVGNFYYLEDTSTAIIRLDVYYVLTSFRSRLSKFRDLLPLVSNC